MVKRLTVSVLVKDRMDTKGVWIQDTMKCTTPDGTEAVRFVIIAGDNTEGAEVKNQIFWDNTEAP